MENWQIILIVILSILTIAILGFLSTATPYINKLLKSDKKEKTIEDINCNCSSDSPDKEMIEHAISDMINKKTKEIEEKLYKQSTEHIEKVLEEIKNVQKVVEKKDNKKNKLRGRYGSGSRVSKRRSEEEFEEEENNYPERKSRKEKREIRERKQKRSQKRSQKRKETRKENYDSMEEDAFPRGIEDMPHRREVNNTRQSQPVSIGFSDLSMASFN